MHSMSTGENPLLELSSDKQAELVQLVENGNLDSIAEATGIDRRTVLQIGAALSVGSIAGGLSARELVQEARAAADTTDGDGNVGLPGDRVDVFAEAIDSNSVSTESAEVTNLVDSTVNQQLLNFPIPNAGDVNFEVFSGAVSTTDVTIASIERSGTVFVTGRDQSPPGAFVEVVTFTRAGGHTVFGTADRDVPPARNYSVSGTDLLLNLGSGTYNVTAFCLDSAVA